MSGKRNRFHSGKFIHRIKCVLCSVLMLVMCMTLFQTGTVAYASGADEDVLGYTAQIGDETMEEGNEAKDGTQTLPEGSEVTEETLPEPAVVEEEKTSDDAGVTAETQDAGLEDQEAEGSGEKEDPKEMIESEEAEEEDEPGINLLAEDAPATYEVTVVYFDENNDRITYSPAETIELDTGSVTTALEAADLKTRTYESHEYALDWVYNSNNQKVADVTYVKNGDGEWQLSYSLTDNAVAGVVGDGNLEIWYTYGGGLLPVSYSPAKPISGDSLNYVDGATSVMAGNTLTFSAYLDPGYTYTVSVTAGSTSLNYTSTATSKEESGETVYTSKGDFTVEIPADTEDEIIVTADYTQMETVTFSPGVFADKDYEWLYHNQEPLFTNVNNNGKSDLEDVSKEYNDDGVDFTFEFRTDGYFLYQLQVNGVSCEIPGNVNNDYSPKATATTVISKDPGGDPSKDCTVTVTFEHSNGSETTTNIITISNAREDVTITSAAVRSRWQDFRMVAIAGEGVAVDNVSEFPNGSADTNKIGDPMIIDDYSYIEFLFGVEKGYKNLTVEFDLFNSTGGMALKQSINLSNGLSERHDFTYSWNRKTYTVGNLNKNERSENNSTYPYLVYIQTDTSYLTDCHIYFEQLILSAEPETYDIVYVLNNGSDNDDSITDSNKYDGNSHNANVTTDVPTAPEGKVFYGWSTEDPTGKDVSTLTILTGGETIDILGDTYYDLIDRTNPTSGYDGTLTLYAVYVDELPAGTPGTAVIKTYLQDSTGAYTPAGSDENVSITTGQSITVYDSYINNNPNVNNEYFTYNAELSNPYLAKTTGSGDEICLYYSLDFVGNVSIDDWQYGDSASDPTAWITVTDATGQKSSQSDSTVGSSYTAGDPVYYIANEDGSKGAQLSGVPADCGSYIVEVTWTQTVSSLDENGQTKTSTVTFTGSKEFKITGREITVTTGDKSKVFDGSALTDSDFTVTEGTLAAGDNLTLNFTGSQTAIGHSENRATVDKITDADGNDVTDQYKVSFAYGILTVTAGSTSVTATKVWDDNKNQDGIRPESATVQLYANGVAQGDPEQMPDAKGNWTYTWEDLPIYSSDATNADDKITYTVEEVDVADGYTAAVSGNQENGFTITNTHTPETVTITGSKTWDDDNNNDECRPDSITINLHANNQKVDSKTVTANDNWSWTFTAPKYANGKEITYSVIEAPIDTSDHYTTSYDPSKLNVTNTHNLETTAVTVVKAWDDSDNQDGLRPAEITVQLCDANGDSLTDANDQPIELTLNESNQWRDDFTGLQKYDDGKLVEYTVKEASVPDGYTASVSGSKNSFIITNTHTTETVSISGTKVWDDADDQDGIRPDSVTINVLADGKPAIGEDEKPITVEATEAGNWAWSVTDLPKYKDEGTEIAYTVTEDAVTDYEEPVITGNMGDGFTITNTYTPATTSISGTKVWDDADNQDGMRPDSVTVNVLADGSPALSANGTAITVAATAEGNWAWSVDDLPKYRDKGTPIVYTVTEDQVTNYEEPVITGDADSGFTITNTHTPEVIEISGTKTWDDDNNNDGYRPTSITIRLKADGSPVKDADGDEITKEVTEAESWSWSFTDLPKYDAGKEITYTLTEDALDHYSTSSDGYDFTNTHTLDQTSLTVNVAWDDSKDQDGLRPVSVTLKLLADGVDTGRTVVLSVENNWTSTFSGLDMFEDEGKKIAYTVEEAEVPDGYTVSITGDATTGYTVTDSHTPDTVEIDVTKIWDDADDQDGKRPDKITVNLLADGALVESAEVTPNRYGEWGWSFNSQPKNRDEGIEIAYTVTEEAVEDYDEPVITGNMGDGFTITNTHTPETIRISGTKTWDDDNNNDGDRPGSIMIRLLADGSPVKDADGDEITKEVTEAESWSWSFTDLPKYDAGKEITYTLTEDALDHYSTSSDGYDFTNTHTLDQTSLTVSVAWDDSKDQDGIRPDSVTLKLLADGEDTGQTAVLSADNNWTSTFSGLDMFEDEGKKIAYTVEEAEVPDGYTVSITGDATTGYTVTDSHTPETIEIDVTKIWDDADDQDGKRPGTITVNLLADGIQVDSISVAEDKNGDWSGSFTDVPKYRDEGTQIVYTVDEDAAADYNEPVITGEAASGFTITNTHTPETVEINVEKIWDDADDQDGKRPMSITVNLLADGTLSETVNLSADMLGDWGWTFTDKPKYSEGKEITYTVTEDSVADYNEPDITGDVDSGFTITNTHAPEVIEVSGTKTWDDDNNNDGVRPASITIRLLADGSPAMDANGEEITKEVTEADNWSWSFTDLPKYSAGKVITYSITEDSVVDYSTEYDSYDVTNTHTPDQTSLTVTAAWDDSSDQDGIRPGSITIRLLADGEDNGQIVVLSAANNWSSSFTGLDIYKDGGKTITYTVEESDVPEGYTVSVTGDASTGYTVTNSHTPATVSVSGSKTWNDDDNNDGDRPESITIRLLADGSQSKELTVTAADNWSWSFTDLPKYRDEGTEIAYTITEDAVANYSASYAGYDVTNTHTPDQTNVTVTKVWDDKNDQDGIRPDSVTVKLIKDGADTGQTLKLNASNSWKGSFTGLDIYEDEGKTVSYTVEEAAVPEGYTMTLTGDAAKGYIITNSHTPETIDLPGFKTWDDYDNDDLLRPESITIRLYADGKEVDSLSVTEDDDDNWIWTFTDMPKYSAGKEITYTITEDAVDHYATSYNNAYDEVINTHSLDQTSLTVSVTFDDQDDRDGIRPDSVMLRLLADGVDTGRTIELSASDNWRGTFTELDINHDGARVQYTVEVAEVDDGYDVSVTGNPTKGYTITFTHLPETIDISGSKTWDDDNNNDGDRPDSITIRLLADGTEVDISAVTADENGDWSFTFAGYDEYRDEGTKIVYTITEDAVDNYSTSMDGYDVTNTHTPDQTSLTVTKVWEDLNDQDGIRPDSVTVKLLADGEDTGETMVLSEDDQWTGIFTGLDMYQDQGEKITYTVEEADVPEGYTAKITGDVAVGYTITNTHETEVMTGPGPAIGNPENGNPKNGNTKNGNPDTGNPTTGAKTGDLSPAQMALMITISLIALFVLAFAALRMKKKRIIK